MPEEVERNPLFLPRHLRVSCYITLGEAVKLFTDDGTYSVDPGGSNSIRAILFWMTRMRSHLAPGLRKVPEELAFDPSGTDFLYDVRKVRLESPSARAPAPIAPVLEPEPRSQTIGRFEEVDRLIMCGMLQSEHPQGGWNGAFCNMFLEAFEEVENLKMAIVALRIKAALSMVTMASTVRP